MKFFVASLTASILAKPNAFKRKTSEERKTERKAGKREFKSISVQIYFIFI